jgi:hypothetical protein
MRRIKQQSKADLFKACEDSLFQIADNGRFRLDCVATGVDKLTGAYRELTRYDPSQFSRAELMDMIRYGEAAMGLLQLLLMAVTENNQRSI